MFQTNQKNDNNALMLSGKFVSLKPVFRGSKIVKKEKNFYTELY